MELDYFATGHAHFHLERFCELLLSNLRETWHVYSSAGPDLKLSKEVGQKNAQIINKQISVASYKNLNCLTSQSN